jgi:sulfonate transport system substrate-binding protein
MKNRKKMIALVLALVFSSFSLAACSRTDDGVSGFTSSRERKVIRIGGVQANLNENAGVALAQGYIDEELAKAGYQAEYSAFAQAGPAINEAFASNALDVAIYGDLPVITAKSNGIDLKIIGITNAQQNYGVLVQADSGIETAHDLEGKKIITGKGTLIQKFFEQWVESEGADLGKIEQLNALADAQSVFVSGESDAIATAQLAVELYGSLTPGSKVIYTTINDPANAAVFTATGRTKFLEENPEAVKALLRALYRGYRYAEENPEKAYEALSTERVSPQIVEAMYSFDTSFQYFDPDITAEVQARIQSTIDFLAKQGLLAEPVELSNLIDTSFFDAVKGEFQ